MSSSANILILSSPFSMQKWFWIGLLVIGLNSVFAQSATAGCGDYVRMEHSARNLSSASDQPLKLHTGKVGTNKIPASKSDSIPRCSGLNCKSRSPAPLSSPLTDGSTRHWDHWAVVFQHKSNDQTKFYWFTLTTDPLLPNYHGRLLDRPPRDA